METTQTSQSLYQPCGTQRMFSAPRWMLMTISLISWVWSFTSICQIRFFFVAETMEEGTDSLEDALEVYRNYYEVRIRMRIFLQS